MEMGKYCKAYELKELRKYAGWSEKPENARKEKQEVDGKEVEVQLELQDDSIVYVQENYVVTHGIFIDMNIIYDNVTDEWKDFLHTKVEPSVFEIPVYEPINIPTAESAPASDAPAGQ
jgi:hypothetical protein